MTYFAKGRYPRSLVLPLCSGGIITLNVLPVFLLRCRMDADTHYPPIEAMSFFTDQHKFSNWVYAVASANMLFWIVLSWTLFSYRHDRKALAGMLVLAFVCTFFPAWIRLFRRSG